MRFKVDENLPTEIAELLRSSGYEAATVLDQQHAGTTDTHLASLCQSENRALVTLDMDFADIRSYPPPGYPGLIVQRLVRQDKPHVLSVFARVLPLLRTGPLAGHLWIIQEDRVRIRQ